MEKTNFFILFSFIILSIGCKSTKTYISQYEYERYEVEGKAETDKSIDHIISPYRNELGKTMNEVIAINDKKLVKRKPNSSLGNWFADVLHKASESVTSTKVDFALQNYGGLRIPALPKGEITVGTIYELMPFDNILIVVKVDGMTTQKLLDRVAVYGGWPQSHGLKFKIDDNQAKDIMINGEPFDQSKNVFRCVT